MRGRDFLNEAGKLFGTEFHRGVKIASGLRQLGLYPDSRTREVEGHVKLTQAAHLCTHLAINSNPNHEDFNIQIAEYMTLRSEESGASFIDDFADILENGGMILSSKPGINLVQRISFSLDRPFVVIVFEAGAEKDDDGHFGENFASQISEEKRVTISKEFGGENWGLQTESVYGVGGPRSFERFSHLKRKALWEIAEKLSRTGFDRVGDDQSIAEQISTYISSK
jgi:hypothetical protein